MSKCNGLHCDGCTSHNNTLWIVLVIIGLGIAAIIRFIMKHLAGIELFGEIMFGSILGLGIILSSAYGIVKYRRKIRRAFIINDMPLSIQKEVPKEIASWPNLHYDIPSSITLNDINKKYK